MTEVAAHVDPDAVHEILDLACGTGRFAPSLAERFNATVIGIDPSQKMLRQAQGLRVGRGRVALVFGYGEALPLRSASIDLIFISMVFHHFAEPVRVAHECRRVLRPGGRVCLRTITADQAANYPYVPFFPGSRSLLEKRLPSVAATRAVFEAASLRPLFAKIVVQQIASDYATYAEKLSSGADTVLASLDPGVFAAGLTSIAALHAAGPPMPIVEPIDLMVFEKVLENE